jgi:hypothetical protein
MDRNYLTALGCASSLTLTLLVAHPADAGLLTAQTPNLAHAPTIETVAQATGDSLAQDAEQAILQSLGCNCATCQGISAN